MPDLTTYEQPQIKSNYNNNVMVNLQHGLVNTEKYFHLDQRKNTVKKLVLIFYLVCIVHDYEIYVALS